MSTLLEGARRKLSRRGDLDARVVGLGDAVVAADGRLEDELIDPAREVFDRASSRLRLSSEHTVVALAGATGSGKSSTFNALADLDLASVGVRRPTTSWATACIWGQKGAAELLEWLGIPLRHQVVRDSMLDTRREVRDLQGLVLLDLPDHDSTEVGHHLEVERLVELADLLVWVLDPQKYADAAIHDRFLRPLARHREVMLVVVNHIDEVAADGRERIVADVRRLLESDGLTGVPVIPISARTGDGIPELRSAIAGRVADKAATRTRIGTDVSDVAEQLSMATGDGPVPALGKAERAALVTAVGDAAGVPIVVDAVRTASARRAQRATGWPITAWVSGLRPDPLRRLHLDLTAPQRDLVTAARSSVPATTHVQQAQVDTCVRNLADSVSSNLSRPWSLAIRRASLGRTQELSDRIDHVLTTTDLGLGGVPVWCRVVRMVQWLLLAAAVIGAGWLLALAAQGFLQVHRSTSPSHHGVPVPTGLLVGGVVLGLLLGLLCRVLIRADARSRAVRVERRLRSNIDGVVDELVVTPMATEIERYERARDGLRRALGSR